MYAHHFGLATEPFSIAPDPRYMFMSERHREALAHLLYGLGGGGFTLLTGEVGAGKTTVCRCFLEQVPKRCNVAYIFNPKLTVTELLQTVCEEFHVPVEHAGGSAQSVKDYVDPLNEFLLRTHAVGQNNVLVIDEAQNLSVDVLEQLRLLTNLETNERKLLQIILIGQPELRHMLARPELRQLAQRVTARYHLGALTEAETRHYIRHRLMVAGLAGAVPFDRKMMRRIHALSMGVPRRINLLCDRALLGAYGQGKARVDALTLERAAREVFDEQRAPAWRRWLARPATWAAGAAAAGLLLGAGIVAAAVWWPRAAGPARGIGASKPVARPGAAPAGGLAAAGPASAALPATQPASTTSAASGAGPAALPVFLSAAALKAAAGAEPASENAAWVALGQSWNLALDAANPCDAALRQRVQCFRGRADFALLRQLNRPGIVTLSTERDAPVHAVIVSLGEQSATLRIGGKSLEVTLASLAQVWRGDFATLWRMPPGYTGDVVQSDDSPAARWLSSRLAALEGAEPGDAASSPALMRARVQLFQQLHGLHADGIAGPVTLMQINRAIGVDEPRLASAR